MANAHWERIQELFDAALALDQPGRDALLTEACDGDEELLREVQSLLAAHDDAGSFIQPSVTAIEGSRSRRDRGEDFEEPPPALLPGTRLGRYEIESCLGKGGMGEVYRARDTRLGRAVAVKVLPSALLTNPDRLRRFEEEARRASSLNHPNILVVYDVGTVDSAPYITMELIEGQTLAALMASSPPSAKQILSVAVQVASGLAKAHAAGIVHRDLKPQNVMVTADGVVKILDFGLASYVPRQADTTASTISPHTEPGTLLGTVGYMSPEQAAGRTTDFRSDQFSLGAILYELSTGRRAFRQKSDAETLAAILRDQPAPIGESNPEAPAGLQKVIARCLAKDPEDRYGATPDLLHDLEDVRDLARADEVLAASASRSRAAAPIRRLRWLAVGLATALILAAAVAALLLRGISAPAPTLVRLTAMRGVAQTPAFSPQGNQIAFSWEGERRVDGQPANFDIWLKMIGSSEVRRLTTDAGYDTAPSWSPDGTQVAFFRGRPGETSGRIYVVSPLGGVERKLSDFPAASLSIGWNPASVPQVSWSPDSRWLAVARARSANETSAEAGGIHLVPVNGGDAHPMTAPKVPNIDWNPAFSPDGHRLAYASCTGTSTPACEVLVVDLRADFVPNSPPRRLAGQGYTIAGLAWTRDGGSVVYSRWWTFAQLWRVPIEGDRPPERIELGRQGMAPTTVPGQDRLAFAHHHGAYPNIYRFEAGRPPVAIVSSPYGDWRPGFSPDGRRIAFASARSGEGREIWVADADGSNPTQITNGPGLWRDWPSWSPDGERIAFQSRSHEETNHIWTVEPDGAGLRRITSGPYSGTGPIWSRDGAWLYFRQHRPEGRDVWRVPAEGGPAHRVTTNGEVLEAQSADGNTLFFTRPGPDGTSPLFSRPRGGGPDRQVADCVQVHAVAVGPDGVYYGGCSPGLREVPLHRLETPTLRSRLLGSLSERERFTTGVAVSPDGRTILFSKYAGDDAADLMMIEHFR